MTSTNPPSETSAGRWTRRIYASVLAVVGVSLLVGGVMLVSAGGSPYYLVAGFLTLGSGVLIRRGNRRGPWLYGALLVGTLG